LFEVLYGGQAGPGKTDCLIAEATRYVWHPKYTGLLLRRTYPRIAEIEDRCHSVYPAMGGVWEATKHRWVFPSGAKIILGHMQYEEDKRNYHGREFQFVGFDELTEFTETQYKFLFSRCRSTIPELKPYIRATTNPGGIGHRWVKKRWKIGTVEPETVIVEEMVSPITGEIFTSERMFIPGRLEDNPTLIENDPQYVINLMQLPELEKQRLLYGIWDAFEGQAFAELNEDVHMFDFAVPAEWEVFGAFDWGFAKPWSYGLYAVDYDLRLYRFAEIYGGKEEGGEYIDEGLRQNDVDIARQIKELEAQFRVKPKYRTADPAIWSKKPAKGKATPGPSPEETMSKENVYFIKADNDRIHGRRELHNRLRIDDDDPQQRPMLYVHKRCKAFWQWMPEMREDEKNPEDIDTKNTPDHVYDEVRYGCMSRPMKPKRAKELDTGSFQAERRKLIKAKGLAKRHGITLESAYGRI
jgi:hypothetical protein